MSHDLESAFRRAGAPLDDKTFQGFWLKQLTKELHYRFKPWYKDFVSPDAPKQYSIKYNPKSKSITITEYLLTDKHIRVPVSIPARRINSPSYSSPHFPRYFIQDKNDPASKKFWFTAHKSSPRQGDVWYTKTSRTAHFMNADHSYRSDPHRIYKHWVPWHLVAGKPRIKSVEDTPLDRFITDEALFDQILKTSIDKALSDYRAYESQRGWNSIRGSNNGNTDYW